MYIEGVLAVKKFVQLLIRFRFQKRRSEVSQVGRHREQYQITFPLLNMVNNVLGEESQIEESLTNFVKRWSHRISHSSLLSTSVKTLRSKDQPYSYTRSIMP